jgi:hypothetical protein
VDGAQHEEGDGVDVDAGSDAPLALLVREVSRQHGLEGVGESCLPRQEKREAWGAFAKEEDRLLDEVEARWGDSAAYQESARRVSSYGKSEWEEINAGNAAIERRIADLMDAGSPPTCSEAMDVAEAQRVHIDRWFYPMDYEFQVLKSARYVEDPRFRAGIEENTRPGAAEWLRAAIIANAARDSFTRRASMVCVGPAAGGVAVHAAGRGHLLRWWNSQTLC